MMTNTCRVDVNINKSRSRLQTNYGLPSSITRHLSPSIVRSSYQRCKDANSFPPMKMIIKGPYMYYIDSKCILTIGNYEKLLRRGTYIEDIRRIATKLGIYEGETKKEQIRSNIFEFLQMSGIAEPIRVKLSRSPSSVDHVSISPSVNNRPPTTTNANNLPPTTTNANSNRTLSNLINNIKPSSSNGPNYTPRFLDNTPYNNYTSSVPSRLRIKSPSNKNFNFGNLFNNKSSTGSGSANNYYKSSTGSGNSYKSSTGSGSANNYYKSSTGSGNSYKSSTGSGNSYKSSSGLGSGNSYKSSTGSGSANNYYKSSTGSGNSYKSSKSTGTNNNYKSSKKPNVTDLLVKLQEIKSQI